MQIYAQSLIELVKQYLENCYKFKNVVFEICLSKRGKRNIVKLLSKELCQLETKVLDDILRTNPKNEDFYNQLNIGSY